MQWAHDFKDSFFNSLIVFILVCIYEDISLPIQQKHAGEVSFLPACLPVCEDLVFTMAASLHGYFSSSRGFILYEVSISKYLSIFSSLEFP